MQRLAEKSAKIQQKQGKPEETGGKPKKNCDFLLTNVLESRKVNGG